MTAAKQNPATKTRTGINPDVFFQAVDGHADHVQMTAEYTKNGLDYPVSATSPEITIRLFMDGDVPCQEIVDQGRGASDQGRFGLISWGESEGRGDGTKTGDKGSGSKGGILHCKEIVIETVPEAGKMYRARYTVEQLLDWLFRQTPIAWVATDKPVRHPVRTSGTRIILRGLGTGTGFQNRGKDIVDPTEVRTAERLVAELAERLPPNSQRFVTVVDYDGKRYPLQVRKIEGEPIIGEAHGVPGAGDISWDAAVVSNRNDQDCLMIGADGTRISWVEFVRLLRGHRQRYTELLKELAPLSEKNLAGLINVTRMGDYRSGSSNSFRGDIAKNAALVNGILMTLIEHMLPAVLKVTNADAPRVTSDTKTMIAHLAQIIRTSTNEIPTGPGQRVTIVKRESTIVVEPGEVETIRIEPPKGVVVVWEDRNSGGTLNAKKGPTVTYTAGAACGSGFQLVARDMTDATKVLYLVKIEIVKEIPFAFKRTYDMFVNDDIRVSIDPRAVAHTSGDIRFEIVAGKESPTDVRVVPKQGQPGSANVCSGTQVGFVDVIAFDFKNPKKYRATTRISVEPGARDKVKPESILDEDFLYRGKRFKIAAKAWVGTGDSKLRNCSDVKGTDDDEWKTISIAFDHVMFANRTGPVKITSYLWQIALRVAESQMPKGTPVDQVIDEANLIYVRIFAPTTAL